MDGFFKKVNQNVNLGRRPTSTRSPDAHPPEHLYVKGRIFEKPVQKYKSQRTTKPTLVQPAKTQISRASAQSDQSSLNACAFYNLRAIDREMNENLCHTGWIGWSDPLLVTHVLLLVLSCVGSLNISVQLAEKQGLVFVANSTDITQN